jgi:1-deoxy-D-xylulose-5-phosphate reductoisomerase
MLLAAALSSVSLLPGSTLPRAPTAQRGALLQMHDPAAPVLTEEYLRETLKRSLGANPKKYIALLGSTGSIGTQTLDICREYPDYFEVISLSAGANVELLAKQIAEFQPKVVGLAAADKEAELRDRLKAAGVTAPEIVTGSDGQIAAAVAPGADTVVTGVVGCAGLLPTIEAIKLGRTIALANKETLISGGPVILPLLKKHGAVMTPADSEHSAIFQCLQGVPPDSLRRVILTASGGAFRDFSTEELLALNKAEPEVVRKKATTHPNWDMGAKITVDSATMMNKGLEVIEAHYLFGVGYDDINVVIHPQSIIHSGIETADSSVICQLGWPDMRLPILYSMSWPHRIHVDYGRGIDNKFDLVQLSQMTFNAPDTVKYPCIPLAFAAGRKAGSMTCCLNAANEAANELFRAGEFDFFGIPKVIESVMASHEKDFIADPTLEDILEVDAWARRKVAEESARAAKILL